ncbi:MAG: AAA family ATPase [Ignavibacteriaceae bacterium]
MTQINYIKELVKYGLENDQEKFKAALNELIEYAKQTKKTNYALQLQSILKDAIRNEQNRGPKLVGSPSYFTRIEDRELNELILEKITSEYKFRNLVAGKEIREQLVYFIQEHKSKDLLNNLKLPVSNKILFYGPSGCGKTLASYVLAGELEKMMYVINLGAIVSSKLGETSKNLAKVFRQASIEDCIIFIDEFDSLGKVRDYDQDHGEMKRIVNTILQLFDYLHQNSIIIAATNQIEMIDNALLRRFDLKIKLDLPNQKQIKELIELILMNGEFTFDRKNILTTILKEANGLSYYSIQKSLIGAIKRSIFESSDNNNNIKIKTNIWKGLLKKEKEQVKLT